jgi:hypothetical protein
VFTASCSDDTVITDPTAAGTMTAAAATITNEVVVHESFGYSAYSPCAITNPFTESLVNGQASFTFVGKTATIAQGRDADWFVSPVFHVTMNANGEVTAEVERYDEVCK